MVRQGVTCPSSSSGQPFGSPWSPLATSTSPGQSRSAGGLSEHQPTRKSGSGSTAGQQAVLVQPWMHCGVRTGPSASRGLVVPFSSSIRRRRGGMRFAPWSAASSASSVPSRSQPVSASPGDRASSRCCRGGASRERQSPAPAAGQRGARSGDASKRCAPPPARLLDDEVPPRQSGTRLSWWE